jgi:pimeloyl-ACP methyl ester carboxylesterase
MHPIPAVAPSPPDPPAHEVLASFRGQPHAFVPAGAHKLAYRKFGHGPDLVFVHGWPLHAATFRAVVPLLAPRFTCHLFDLPGSGQTRSPRGAPVDLVSHALALRAAVDALGLHGYGLVAHDSGGFSARVLAADDPRVVAVVSGDTEIPGHVPDIIKTLLLAAKTPGGADIMRFSFRSRAMRRSDIGFAGCFADIGYIDGDFHELLVAPLLASRAAWMRQVEILRSVEQIEAPLRAAHTAMSAPTLFVWGDADPIFPVEKARAMLPALKRARLEVLRGAKAFHHEERAPEFVALAAPFLAEAFASSRGQA